MKDDWKKFEGHVLDDKFPLQKLLGSTSHSAVFLTQSPATDKNSRYQIYAVSCGAEVHQTNRDRRPPVQAAGYNKVERLCIDEIAYLSFDAKAADTLYEVINRRYESKSVIVTSNRACKE